MRLRRLLILLFPLVFACNKDETSPSANSGSGGSGSEEFSLQNCYGKITFDEYITLGTGSSGIFRLPLSAMFTDVPLSQTASKNLDIGVVSVNGIVLKINNGALGSKSYSDTTGLLFSPKDFSLIASGNSVSPTFTFHYQSGSPALTDTAGIPTLYNQTEGVHLQLEGIVDADSLVFTLKRQNYYQIRRQVSTAAQSTVKIDIDRAELSTLMENNLDADMSIVVFRKKLIRAGTRDYFVFSRKTYSKHVYIKLF